MLYPPGFYYVKKTKRFVVLSSDKSSERNLSCFFDIIKPRRMEHLQSEEPFSSDPYFSTNSWNSNWFIHEVQMFSFMKIKLNHEKLSEHIWNPMRSNKEKVSLNVPCSHSLFFFYPLHFIVYFTNMHSLCILCKYAYNLV